MSDGELRYKRILVKISGEALMGDTDYGVDPVMLRRIALEVQELLGLGVQVALVIGGGNIFRGAGLARAGMDRVTGDHMGMLATVMNSLAMQDALVVCRLLQRMPERVPEVQAHAQARLSLIACDDGALPPPGALHDLCIGAVFMQ